MIDALLELMSPTRCAGCDLPGGLLCDRCRLALPRIDLAEACPRCGAPDARRHCEECRGRDFAFEQARCAGALAHPLARLVVLYKDGGERRLAVVLGGLLAEAVAEWDGWPEAVVAIPASSNALVRRGFDHGSLLGGAIAAHLGVPSLPALVAVSRGDQRRLGRKERASNVASGLRAAPGVTPPARVLLVDDVFTTGATLDAAATVLRGAGADRVRAAAIARVCEW